jgi:hypothetical protein
MSKKTSWQKKAEQLRRRKPDRASFVVPNPEADQAALEARQAVEAAVVEARARLSDADTDQSLSDLVAADPHVMAARKALAEAEKAAEAAEVPFEFEALAPHAYAELMLEHMPEGEQVMTGMRWNPETFTPALIAACSVEPMTAEEFDELCHPVLDEDGNVIAPPALTAGEVALFFGSCVQLNERPRIAVGKGSRPTAD